MVLNTPAGRSGRVVDDGKSMCRLSSPKQEPLQARLILLLLDVNPDEPLDDENLIDYGLDSVRMMAPGRAFWRKVHGDIDSW